MPMWLYHAGTVVLGLAALVLWTLTQWSLDAVYAGSPAWPLLLLCAASTAILGGIFFTACFAAIVDVLEPVWGERKDTAK